MKIFSVIKTSVNKYFSDEEAIYFIFVTCFSGVAFFFLGEVITPILIALFVAFCLFDLCVFLESYLPRAFAAFLIVTLLFGSIFLLIVFLLPEMYKQLETLLKYLPTMLAHFKSSLYYFQEDISDLVSIDQMDLFFEIILQEASQLQSLFFDRAFQNVFASFSLIIYMVLLPILVFYFLKDREILKTTFSRAILPTQRSLLVRIFSQTTLQLKYYLKGKVIEACIIAILAYLLYRFYNIPYVQLLSILTGLMAFIPFVGSILISIPIVLVAVINLTGVDLYTFLFLYAFLQFFEGYILVPVLFSRLVNLPSIFILLALIVFGGLWGMWGLLFAIPLATVVRAIYEFWPTESQAVE